ncbi:MAG: HAMP domain-containing histidine kinase [Massilibacteroides sp.]|nr:HAMP domain-containing histidine kinase [Massilibacteroides sp.]
MKKNRIHKLIKSDPNAIACKLAHITPWIYRVALDQISFLYYEGNTVTERELSIEEFFSFLHQPDVNAFTQAMEAIKMCKKETLLCSISTNLFTEEFSLFTMQGETDYDEAGSLLSISGLLQPDKIGQAFTIGKSEKITKQTLDHLLKAKEKAELKNKQKSNFISNLSHEIRTPLNAIVGFSDLLMLTEDPEERKEYMDIIRSSNDFLSRLLGKVLDLSRIESGRVDFIYSTFSLQEMFNAAQKTFGLQVKKEVELIYENDDDEQDFVYSEPTRLNQVLSNFLSNAVKHTEKGSIRFGYRMKKEGYYCYVTDTGAGMKPEVQAHVFDRFAKLNRTQEGTGLGLSICYTIMEKLQGSIGVMSEVGKGSTFWFLLPHQEKA